MHSTLRLMDPSAHLLDLYQKWKELTEQEGAAILASNWLEVRHCQKAKQQLQPEIIRLSDQLKKTAAPGSHFEHRIRESVNELIQMETRNSATLADRLQTARTQKDDLDRTSKRLRQVHKSYVPAQGNAWSKYS